MIDSCSLAFGLSSRIQWSNRRSQSSTGRRSASFVAMTLPRHRSNPASSRPAVTNSASGASEGSAVSRSPSNANAWSWSVRIACSWRAALPSASHAHGTGGSPCAAIASSSSRRVAASIANAIT